MMQADHVVKGDDWECLTYYLEPTDASQTHVAISTCLINPQDGEGSPQPPSLSLSEAALLRERDQGLVKGHESSQGVGVASPGSAGETLGKVSPSPKLDTSASPC